MQAITHKTHYAAANSFRVIIMFSAWGFALVITSCLFLWLGYLLDELLGTTPKFMLGMLFLAIIGCFIEIYQEALDIITLHKTEISQVHQHEANKSRATMHDVPWYTYHIKRK